MTAVTGLAGRNLRATVNTLAYEALEDLLAAGSVAGMHDLYSRVIPGFEGMKTLEANITAGPPMLRKWTGARRHKRLRGYTNNATTALYEATLDIPVSDYNGKDPTAIRNRVAAMLSGAKGSGLTQLVHNFLHTASAATSPIGYDGVVLFGSTHPHVGSTSGTGTNTDTTAFSASQANTILYNMSQYKNEEGDLLGIRPTILRCGKKLTPLAQEAFEATERVISVDSTGVETGTRLAAAASTNVYKGMLTVVEDPRITTLGYYLHDPDAEKPVHIAFSRNFEIVSQTTPESSNVYERDMMSFGVNVEFAMMAVDWHGIYWGDNDAS